MFGGFPPVAITSNGFKLLIQNACPPSHQDGEALGGLQLFQLLQVLHDGSLPGPVTAR